jgi:hypothetical protein
MVSLNKTEKKRTSTVVTRIVTAVVRLRPLQIVLALGALTMLASSEVNQQASTESFNSILHAVRPVHEVVVLSSPDKQAVVAVCPALQGRVLTSSANGPTGAGFGWVNTPLIQSRRIQPHFNAYGGEDRVWIGPEGGQYSVFFAPGVPFDLDHWNTPAPVDTEPFELVSQSDTSVRLRKRFELLNYSGSRFHVQIDREVALLPTEGVWASLNLTPLPHLKLVGYESRNRLTNAGNQPWTKQTGLLSLWILGQFQASPSATIAIPIWPGDALGKRVTSDYFGEVPADRLAVQQSAIFLKADAGFRSKLGVSPMRTRGVLGSYDAGSHVLTIVQFTTHGSDAEYVNSLWKIQDNPFHGDVANAYNDGPLGNGKAGLGHFYELESSSPAAAIRPGESVEHIQRTIHLVGNEADLDQVARSVLGVSLTEIRASLPADASR